MFPTLSEIAEMVATVEEAFTFRSNASCTLYNKYIVGHAEQFQRTQIPVVAWFEQKDIVLTGSGAHLADDKAQIKIPFSRANYLPTIEWQNLSAKTGKWTLQEGDLIVRGLVTDTINSGFSITDLRKKYEHVLQITWIEIKDKGLVFKHWKIGAK